MSPRLFPLAVLVALSATVPVSAQLSQSEGYKFREAVRKGDGAEVTKTLEQPGTTVVNSRDQSSGEGAIHIVVKRGDETYLRYLLAKGADANLRDARGNSPLLLAVNAGQAGMVDILIRSRANLNLANTSGETPLIRAVQRRDLGIVRALLTAGANPDQPDVLAGKSARDYAGEDTRNPAIAKVIADTPRGTTRAVAGPRL